MNVLLVDDEPLARARLRRLLQVHPDIQVMGEAGSAEVAERALNDEPDLIFLDIEMPGESGLAWAARLRQRAVPPAIIFTTAHPQHALDAFVSSPVDYLLKPIEPRVWLPPSPERVNPPARSRSLSLGSVSRLDGSNG